MIPPHQLHPRYLIPVWSDPKLAADAEAQARKLAGGDASAYILARARDLAATQIDLHRVDKVRHELSRGLPRDRSFDDLVAAAKLTQVRSAARQLGVCLTTAAAGQSTKRIHCRE